MNLEIETSGGFVKEGFANLEKTAHVLHFAHKKSQMDSIFDGTFKGRNYQLINNNKDPIAKKYYIIGQCHI